MAPSASLLQFLLLVVAGWLQRRLAADPAVARVIPDVRFTVPGTATAAPASKRTAGGRRQFASVPLHNIPGACAPVNKSLLAPEGLALTGTASDSATARTARSLGFTGAGVKVAFLADGLDPGNVNLRRAGGASVFADYRDFTGNGPGVPTAGVPERERATLAAGLAKSKSLETAHSMRRELAALWERSSASGEQLVAQLQDWCRRAEASGIVPLRDFSIRLRSYA